MPLVPQETLALLLTIVTAVLVKPLPLLGTRLPMAVVVAAMTTTMVDSQLAEPVVAEPVVLGVQALRLTERLDGLVQVAVAVLVPVAVVLEARAL